MKNISAQNLAIHERALQAAAIYKKSEAALLNAVADADVAKVYLDFGFNSLFSYCVSALKLSEATSYSLISVARKSKKVPELKDAVCAGELSLSKASKIVSVVDTQNKLEWIEKAKSLPRLALEKEVAKVNPQASALKPVRYITENTVALSLGLSEEIFLKLKRVQELESKRQKRNVSFEDVIAVLVPGYLDVKDPVVKAELENKKAHSNAKRAGGSAQKSSNSNSSREELRTSIPFERHVLSADLKRRVLLRDRDQCQRCASSWFTEVHHIIPVSHGGHNELANLQTLCGSCHQLAHH